MQSAVTGLVSLVQSAVHALFGFLKQQIDQVWALCTAPINIPVVTSFYQTTVVPGEQLTMLSLIALAAAIPLTVTYKLVTGQSGSMFTDDDLAAVRNPNWSGYTAITSSIQQTFGSAGGAADRSVAPAAPMPAVAARRQPTGSGGGWAVMCMPSAVLPGAFAAISRNSHQECIQGGHLGEDRLSTARRHHLLSRHPPARHAQSAHSRGLAELVDLGRGDRGAAG